MKGDNFHAVRPKQDTGAKTSTEGSVTLTEGQESISQLLDQNKKLNSPQVRRKISKLDKEHTEELLTWQKEKLGFKVVHSFEDHDLKFYDGFVKNMGEVYESLAKDPVEVGRDTDGYAAARHHIGALEAHDIIEDGLDEVLSYKVPLPSEIRDEAIEQEVENVPKLCNTLWDGYVKHQFTEMAWNLGLSEEKSKRFGEENTEFYRRHTGVHEDRDDLLDEKTDRGSQDKVMQQGAYEFYAVEAQKTLISGITDRNRDDPRVEELALGFLNVVNSHDAHTLEDQLENVRRMSDYYQELLSDILALEA